MNFEISANEVEFAHLNVRSERHGDQDVTAIDLKLRWTTGNAALALFDPGLPAMLYKPEEGARQRPVEGMEALDSRVFPDLGPLKWKVEVTGLKLVIEHGLAGKSDLVLSDCTADHFVIEALDGGSVEITFRVRTICKDERILGKLAMLIKRDLPMSIQREHEPSADLLAGEEEPAKKPKQRSATEVFAGTP